jgi:hypothetical protein
MIVAPAVVIAEKMAREEFLRPYNGFHGFFLRGSRLPKMTACSYFDNGLGGSDVSALKLIDCRGRFFQ